jgi:hypothetical protein
VSLECVLLCVRRNVFSHVFACVSKVSVLAVSLLVIRSPGITAAEPAMLGHRDPYSHTRMCSLALILECVLLLACWATGIPEISHRSMPFKRTHSSTVQMECSHHRSFSIIVLPFKRTHSSTVQMECSHHRSFSIIVLPFDWPSVTAHS